MDERKLTSRKASAISLPASASTAYLLQTCRVPKVAGTIVSCRLARVEWVWASTLVAEGPDVVIQEARYSRSITVVHPVLAPAISLSGSWELACISKDKVV
jgi:hypothetical protein